MALAFVDGLRRSPAAVTQNPGERHFEIFQRLCRDSGAIGNRVPDAYLAAIAIESNVTGSLRTAASLATRSYVGRIPQIHRLAKRCRIACRAKSSLQQLRSSSGECLTRCSGGDNVEREA